MRRLIDPLVVLAALKYVRRCHAAGDKRSTIELLREIVSADDAAEIAELLETTPA